MKTFLVNILLLLFILAGCNKSDSVSEDSFVNPIEQPNDNSENPIDGTDGDSIREGLINISLNISLPKNSIIDEGSLVVSSLFTESTSIDENVSNVDVFEGEAFEIAMAENSNGDLVLMNYFLPNASDIIMDSRTTAIALVMIQPWTSILSVDAKKDLILQFENLQEFETLVESIENSLINDGIPLRNDKVLSDLNILSQLIVGSENNDKNNNYIEDREPLFFAATENSISTKNASSLAYGIKYGDDVFVLEGVEKKVLIAVIGRIYDYFNNTESLQPTETKFTVVNDGFYEIDASNGAVLPSLQKTTAGDEVRIANIGKLALSLWASMTSIFDLIPVQTDSDCYFSIGNYIFKEVGDEMLKDFNERDLMNRILESMQKTEFALALGPCLGANLKSPLGRVLFHLSLINASISTIETTALLHDWKFYDSEIDFCTSKIDGIFQECQAFAISEELAFGNLPTGLFGSVLVEFENLAKNGFNITSIVFPNSYYSISIPSRGITLINGQALNQDIFLEAGEKLEVLVSYDAKPLNEALYELSGDLFITTDIQDETHSYRTYNFPVSGAVVNALELQDLNGNIISEIQFPTTEIETYSEKQSVKIVNTSDYDIVFPAASSPDLTTDSFDGFVYSWDEKIINASGAEFLLDFRFYPKSASSHSLELVINTGTSQNLSLSLLGEGINADNQFSGTWSTVSYHYFEEFYTIGAIEEYNYLERCNLFLERERLNFFNMTFDAEVNVNKIIDYDYSRSQSRAEDRFYLESDFECNEVRYAAWETYFLDDPLIIIEIVSPTHLKGRLDDEVLDIIINNENSMTIYVDHGVDPDEPPIYTYNLVRQ